MSFARSQVLLLACFWQGLEDVCVACECQRSSAEATGTAIEILRLELVVLEDWIEGPGGMSRIARLQRHRLLDQVAAVRSALDHASRRAPPLDLRPIHATQDSLLDEIQRNVGLFEPRRLRSA